MKQREKKNVLLVYAHPEPTSLTRQLVDISTEVLTGQGHGVVHSDLYGMRWKAVFDAEDFPRRANAQRLSFIEESAHAFSTGQQTDDVAREQEKLKNADAVILQFPLWWFSAPAILKGWIERVYAYGFGYGFNNEGNRFRYGEGALKGKRALVSVLTGGGASDYGPRGINGEIEQLLFPLTHGALFYPGMDVLPTHVVHGTGRISSEGVDAAKKEWRSRLGRLFTDSPIPFRTQNGGDYVDRHTLKEELAPGEGGLAVHVAK
jgi:NAD(P)H dehydrogenase (quinone)